MTSRRVVRLITVTVLVLSNLAVTAAESDRPNVILIFTDDQGSIDLNCYGSHDLFTPHLDRLAAEGTRFTQMYVGAPVCSPSRAALLTGRYPQGAGVPGNMPSHPGRDGMPTEQVTIAEMMKQADYVTGHVGKWHLGYTPATMPNGQGFDHSFGHMGGCIDNYSHFFYWVPPNRHDLWRNGQEVWHDGQFFGDLMVKECKQFIDRNQNQPFFLYWAINMPHYPLQGTAKWREKYQDLEPPRRMYAEFVSTMDEMVGQVLTHLDDSGLRKNTLVIYLSDHGHSVESRTFSGGGNSGVYRGHKFTLWEGGIRVPCIVSWPGRLTRGSCAQPAWPSAPIGCQRLPITATCRFPNAPSMACVLHPSSNRQRHRPPTKSCIGKPAVASIGPCAPATGNWFTAARPRQYQGRQLPAAKDFLSDMSNDVTETKNLAAEHPDVVKRLSTLHEQWSAGVGKQ